MKQPVTLFLSYIILALCSLAYVSTPAHAQESTTGSADPSAEGLQQITVRTADMASTTITSAIYWSSELQDAQRVLTSDGEVLLPGAADVVDLIVVLKSEAVAPYQRAVAKGGKLTLEQQVAQVATQQSRIVTEQRQLLDALKAERIPQAIRGQYTYLVNAVALSAELGRIDEIAQLPDVAHVAFDYQAQIQLADSVPLIGANSVWAQQDGQGQALRGQGIRIAIIDSGIDYTHPDLGGCFGSGCRVIDGYDFVNDDADPMDDNNHGTHVAGITAANGTLQGVAPEATLLAYKVCNQYGSCANSAIIAALERAADPDQNPLTDDAVDVVNMSLGGPGAPDDPLAQAANQAVAEGIIVVAAAGNSGSYRSVGSPGVAADVLTVGASTKNDTMASFSSKGWAGDYQTKPDVVAPGQAINAPVVNNSYEAFNGTSMASPHVAGAAALLKQAHPNWTPDQIKLSLMNSALDLGVDPFAQGAGRIRLAEALHPTLFAAPGALSFGLIDPTVNSWSKSLPLTLTNPTNGAQTVQVAVGNLPNGLTASLSQSTVTVAGGQSAVVNVTVTVDNSVLPFPQNDGFVYHGAIAITQNSVTYRVPLSVVKAALIEVQPAGGEWPVYLRNGGNSQFINVADQSSVLVPVTPGSYDLIAGYGYVDGYPTTKRFVFHEGIQVTQQSTQVAVVLQPGDAGHQLVTNFTDSNGQTTTVSDRNMLILYHKNSGWGAFLSSTGQHGPETFFSTVSNAYYIESCAYQKRYPAEQVVYDLCYALDGISSSQTQQLAMADLKKLTYRVEPTVDTAYALPLFFYMFPSGFGIGPWYRDSDWVTAPFTRTFYHTPINHPNAMRRKFMAPQQDANRTQLPIQAYTAEFRVVDHTQIELQPRNYNYTTGWQVEPEMTSAEAMSLPQAPVYWAGHFSNTNTEIRLDANAQLGTYNGYYPFLRDQFQNIIFGMPIDYTLTNSSGVNSGSLSQNRTILTTPGAQTLEIVYQSRFNGTDATGSLFAHFDTTAADRNPPMIAAVAVTGADGLHASTLHGTGSVTVELRDDQAVSDVTIAIDWGQGWQTLNTTSNGSRYVAQVPVYTGNTVTPVALRIEAVDSSGNLLRNEISPAFLIKPGSTSYQIDLYTGWNLIALPVTPVDPAPAAVLASIAGAYDFVYGYVGCDGTDPWKQYDPNGATWLNDLTTVTPTQGYWIHVTEDTTLTVTGTSPTAPSVALCAGWNLIGYPAAAPVPLPQALSSVQGQYSQVQAYVAADPTDVWKKYDPSAPAWLNDLAALAAGEGYWLYATEQTTLSVE